MTAVTADGSIRQIFLKREAATGAEEGIFTCLITDDNNEMRSLCILYPSELYYFICVVSIIIVLCYLCSSLYSDC